MKLEIKYEKNKAKKSILLKVENWRSRAIKRVENLSEKKEIPCYWHVREPVAVNANHEELKHQALRFPAWFFCYP